MSTDPVPFTLDGEAVVARPGETIWDVARRRGTTIPHLCHRPEPGYRADGNCRACVVEIEGERVLAASCIRKPTSGMVVRTASARAETARAGVFALLRDEAPAAALSFDGRPSRRDPAGSSGRGQANRHPHAEEAGGSPAVSKHDSRDLSHPAMAVDLDACIHCTLCVRACREVQVNDVIGMAFRGHRARVVFDFADPMGESTCVACGECVQACPTGALKEKTLAAGAEPDRAVDSLCPYCGVGCQLTFRIQDERIVAVDGRDGPANRNRLCVKGRFGFDYIHHPHRLTVPLVRKDGVPKSGDDVVDPANPWTHFREASWDEALERAAAGFRRIRHDHGPAALAGFGSAKGSNEEAYLFQKLVRTGFGTNNVDHCTRLCHASSVAALMETIGSGAVTAPVSECANADVIVVIGANPAVNHPVAATFIKNAVKRGARLVVMDPRGQALERHASHMLRFRPGSDVALLNALMHVIVAEELYDRDYVARMTEGFEELAAHVADYPPERMALLCGIDAATLRTVARLYAKAEAAITFWGMGISQHTHGTDNARCLIALALLCGHVGKPGAGLHPLRGQNNVQGASDAGLIPMVYPDYRAVEKPEVRGFYEELWDMKLDPARGLTVVEIVDAACDGRIKGMYVMGENPAMSDPDLDHARAGLANLDHLVVQDLFLTETAFHADVVLPASAFPEKTGTFTNTDRRVQLGRQALDPPGQARQDWWIVQELARRLGLAWDYAGPAEVYEELRRCMPPLAGIPWTRLEAEDSVVHPCEDESAPGREVLFGEAFPTPTGRGKLVPAAPLPPDELPDDSYPMVLTTGRILEHWHTGSMTRRAGVLEALEPDPVCQLSPATLERLGVAPGGRVTVTTRRGAITLTARADRAVDDGMVFMPFCYAEAAANLLTNPKLDPFGKIPEFKFCAARVDRAAE